jgi:hypothetical protein
MCVFVRDYITDSKALNICILHYTNSQDRHAGIHHYNYKMSVITVYFEAETLIGLFINVFLTTVCLSQMVFIYFRNKFTVDGSNKQQRYCIY